MGKLNDKLNEKSKLDCKIKLQTETMQQSLKNLQLNFFDHSKKNISKLCDYESHQPMSGDLVVNIRIKDNKITVKFKKVKVDGSSSIRISSDDRNNKIEIKIIYRKTTGKWHKKTPSFKYGLYFFKPITPLAIEGFICDLF